MNIFEVKQSDASLEAMLGSFQIAQSEGLVCDSDKRIDRMCVNPKCEEVSLICNDLECQNCKGESHLECNCITLKGVTSRLKRKASRQKEFLEGMSEIESFFIRKLQEDREQLAQKFRFGKLEDRYLEIIEKIYRGKQFKFLKGKEARQFWQRLQGFGGASNQALATSMLDTLRGAYEKFFAEISELKKRMYEAFSAEKPLEHGGSQFQLDSAILSKKLTPDIEQLARFRGAFGDCASNILDELRSGQKPWLREALGNPVRVSRIFQASKNDFKAAAFHQQCDNKGDLLVLVRTEFGKTIGGFTHYPWTSRNDYYGNPERRTFLFSLDMMEKFVPQGNDKLLFDNSGWGPGFGGGHDILISNGCDKNKSSRGNLGDTYNREGANKLEEENQETYRMFSGATSDIYYRVVQYEVFEVCYQ